MSLAERPAEWSAVAAAVALLVARALGVDDAQTITAIGVVIGALPALVTGIVTLVRRRGAKPAPPPS